MKPTEHTFTSPLPILPNPRDEYLGPNVNAAHGINVKHQFNDTSRNMGKGPLLDYTTALTLTVAIGLSLLVLNVILFAALLYRRDRNQITTKINYDSVSVQPLCTVDSGLRAGSVATQDGMTSPGKDIITCAADIQVTELHTFPTPPDIGDRNTEVTSYTSNTGTKRHGCSGMPTSQFVPPPPLQAGTSSMSTHQTQLDSSKVATSVGSVIGCSSVGVINSPCSSNACFSEQTSSSYRQDVSSGHFQDAHIGSNINQNFQVNVSVGNDHNSSVETSGTPTAGSNDIPPCTTGGTCQMTEQPGGSTFPSTSSAYCPPSPYCNEFPISQYSSERFTNSPNQYSGNVCQFATENTCNKFISNQNQRHGTGTILGLRNPEGGAIIGQRSSTLTRVNPSSASGTCLQNIRKPKPPPRDGSSGTGYSTLPRQSSLDSSTHIVA